MTQHGARDPDPPLLRISDGEVSSNAGQETPSLQTLTDILVGKMEQLPWHYLARKPTQLMLKGKRVRWVGGVCLCV